MAEIGCSRRSILGSPWCPECKLFPRFVLSAPEPSHLPGPSLHDPSCYNFTSGASLAATFTSKASHFEEVYIWRLSVVSTFTSWESLLWNYCRPKVIVFNSVWHGEGADICDEFSFGFFYSNYQLRVLTYINIYLQYYQWAQLCFFNKVSE